jgi:hypothetical protein
MDRCFVSFIALTFNLAIVEDVAERRGTAKAKATAPWPSVSVPPKPLPPSLSACLCVLF